MLVSLASYDGSALTSFDLEFDDGLYPAAIVYDGCVFVHGPERRLPGVEGEYFHLPSVTVNLMMNDVGKGPNKLSEEEG